MYTQLLSESPERSSHKSKIIGVVSALAVVAIFMTYSNSSSPVLATNLNQVGCTQSSVFCNDFDIVGDDAAIVTYVIHID
jgi:hypothetical protein